MIFADMPLLLRYVDATLMPMLPLRRRCFAATLRHAADAADDMLLAAATMPRLSRCRHAAYAKDTPLPSRHYVAAELRLFYFLPIFVGGRYVTNEYNTAE